MIGQAALPLSSPTLPDHRPGPPHGRSRGRRGVEYLELGVRHLLNRSRGSRLPFHWTINPYRGCELGCTYCYARHTHSFLELHDGRDFERRIFVKRGAAGALERKLRRAALAGQPIAIGTATDPYQPAEQRFGVTRSLLEVFRRVEGLEISITTKSPLILRDVDLLAELDCKHVVTVQISVMTLDRHLVRRLEPGSPTPQARIEALRRLADAGLAVRLHAIPLAPGINEEEATLRPLLEAAADAGATDVAAAPLTLRPAVRSHFYPWLAEELPHLVPVYRLLYGRRSELRPAQRRELLQHFRRLRLELGFPRAVPGRS